jgi:hypothetical protein
MDKNLYLIYIHLVGYTHKNIGIYEFIFSENPNFVEYEEWGWSEVPPKEFAMPPVEGYYKKIVRFEFGRFKFKLLSEMTNFFKYLDGYDKIIAIGWEDEEDNLELESEINPVKRLVFHYGDTFEDIVNKMYERDINFE